jgi:ligand-binding SRPBCC domain-containing protein
MWNHEHGFSEHKGGTRMRDRVTYALPLGWVGRIAHWAAVKRDVEKIFDFRVEAMGRLFPV